MIRAMSAGLPQSYPFKLQQLLAARYTAQTLVMENEGKANEAAADAVARLPGILRATAPEVVILMHGVNDVTFLGQSGVTRVTGYLNTMARDARFAGARVILCTLPPQRPGGFRAGEPAVIANFNQALRDLARGEGAILADFARDVRDLNLIGVDGLHPTESGYARMAQILFDLVRSQFEITNTMSEAAKR
jgi:lysophospholipase L1-like esterase